MIFVYLFIGAGVRLMVTTVLDLLLFTMRMNHLIVPPLEWKREILEILITFTIITPIYAGLAART